MGNGLEGGKTGVGLQGKGTVAWITAETVCGVGT